MAKTHNLRIAPAAYERLRRIAYKKRKPMIQIISDCIMAYEKPQT